MSLQDEKKVPPDAVASSPPPSPPNIAEGKTVSERYADVTLGFVKQYAHTVEPLTPEKEARLLRKLYLSIMTLLLILNLMLFVCTNRSCSLRCSG